MSKKLEARIKALEDDNKYLNVINIFTFILIGLLALWPAINRDDLKEVRNDVKWNTYEIRAEEDYTHKLKKTLDDRIYELEYTITYNSHIELFEEYKHIMGYGSFSKCIAETSVCLYKNDKLVEELTISEVHENLEKAKAVLERQKKAMMQGL